MFVLQLRACLAILLTLSFYALSLAMLIIFAYITCLGLGPVLDPNATVMSPYLAAAGLGGAGVVLWSILPRWSRFKTSGAFLDLNHHPKLKKVIEEVAQAAGQRMPDEVYLIPEVNAGVSEHGGMFGLGRRRILELGVPLMGSLTVSEFRAVLAHEFGHFCSGDTIWASRLYHAYGSMARGLEASSALGSALQLPYYVYCRLFLRLTLSLFRHHELNADRLATGLAGSNVQIAALKKINAATLAIDRYIEGVMPVLKAGYHPPFLQGFHEFCSDPDVAVEIDKGMRRVLRRKADPYDTHPAIADRIAAVEGLPKASVPDPDPSAATLFEDLREIEHRVLETLFEVKRERAFQPLSWEQVIPEIFVPMWKDHYRRYGAALKGITPAKLPECAREITEFGASLWPRRALSRVTISGEQARDHAHMSVGAALTVALLAKGWRLDVYRPGKQVRLCRGEKQIEPFEVLRNLVRVDSKRVSTEQWLEECRRLGIADVDLGETVIS